jgi:hypothetical protein
MTNMRIDENTGKRRIHKILAADVIRLLKLKDHNGAVITQVQLIAMDHIEGGPPGVSFTLDEPVTTVTTEEPI